MLDFRVNTFLMVVKLRSYTKAAQALGLTQPAVSNHIRYLEDFYNVRLFDYKNKRLEITEAGFRIHSALITMKADEARLLNEFKTEVEPPIRFGATKTAGEYLICDRIATIAKEYSLEFKINNTRHLLDDLKNGKIDFAIVEGYFDSNQFDSWCLSRQEYVAIKSPQLKIGKKAALQDILDIPIYIRENGSGSREIFNRFLEEHNLSYDSFAKVNIISDIKMIKRLVESGAGISFMYKMAVEEELTTGKLELLYLLDMEIYHDIMFIFNRNTIYQDKYLKIFNLLKEG